MSAHITFEPCPISGDGVHRWLLSQANRCRLARIQPGTTFSILRDGSRHCGRQVPDSEIQAAVKTAFESAWTPRRNGCTRMIQTKVPSRSWPESDPARIAEITASGLGLADLWEASPIQIEDSESHTEALIDSLFPGNPLLCCGWSRDKFDTRPRIDWRGELSDLQLVVPSPMTSVWGVTKDGKPSKHTLSNTGPRRFLVVEFDHGEIDGQAAILLHLGRFAPLVLALHSGGKSLHGWFLFSGQPEAKVRKFFRYAVVLGADPALWCPTQFVRMPDGHRDSGCRQTVFFFSMGPLKGNG